MEPLEDLRIAVSVGAAAQHCIQHADTKAAVLLTGLAGTVALAANQPGLPAAALRAGPVAAACMIGLAAAIVAGTCVAGWHLGRCLTPRLTGPGGRTGNRFALPDLGARRRPVGPAPVERQRREAWAAAEALAGIAMRKYRAIRSGIPWMAVAVAGSVGWLCLTAAIGGQ